MVHHMCATVTLQTTFLLTRAFFRNPEDFWLSRASNTWLIPTTLTEDGHGPRGTGLNLTHHAKLGAVSDLTGQPGRLSSISDSISDVRLLILAIPGGNRLPPPSLPRTIYAIACGVWPPFSPRLYIPYTSCPPRFRYLPPPPRVILSSPQLSPIYSAVIYRHHGILHGSARLGFRRFIAERFSRGHIYGRELFGPVT